jgi:perosamine synthetase
MSEKGVDSRPFFFPISLLPMHGEDVGSTANKLSESGFNLPTFVGLEEHEIEKVCDAFVTSLHHA